MTIPAIGGALSWAIQGSMVGDADYIDTAFNFYRHRTPRVNMGTIQRQEPLPFEVGGGGVFSMVFKSYPGSAGQFELYPRLDGAFGWLLLAALGKCNTTNDAPEAGMYRHEFTYQDDGFTTPYIAFRREVPHSNAGLKFGETGADCRIGNIEFMLPPSGPIGARVNFMGRLPTLERGGSWTYANSYDDAVSIPVSNKGFILIGGQEYPFVGMSLMIVNNLSAPEQTQVVGKYFMEDVLVLTRGCQIRVPIQWSNPDVYQAILTGEFNGTEWTALPWLLDTVGSTKAFYARFESPGDADSQNYPYAIEFEANRLVWSIDGPPELRGGDIVTFNLTGTLLDPPAGDYFKVRLENTTASYALPSVPTLGLAANLDWTEGEGATELDATATLSDEATNMNGGYVIVRFRAGDSADDELSIINEGTGENEVGIDSDVVKYGGVSIGKFTGGTSGEPLKIVFNADAATPTAVQAVLRKIAFDNSGTIAPGVRFVRVSVGNGDGGFAYDEMTITVSEDGS